MKLIDIMKRYNKCILKENAKLRSIYNALIRESGAEGEETDECDVCGDPSCKDGEKCGAKPAKPANEDECDEADTMTLEEFLGEKEAEDGDGEEGGKPKGKPAEKKPADDGDEDDEGGKPKGKSQDECELEEEEELTELQDADDFFNGKSSEDKPAAKKPAKKATDEEEESGETNESAFSAPDFYQNVSEQYKRKPEAALGESLRRHYKKANRRLFNF